MIRILPSKFEGSLSALPSKAEAQRLLFMAAMAPFPTHIYNVPPCEDIDTVIECLTRLGCKFDFQTDSSIILEPFPKNTPRVKLDLDFKDSATCAKLTLALAASMDIAVNCTGSTNLQKRKLFSLLSRMAIRGVMFDRFAVPCQMSGRLDGGDYTLEGLEGEQSISALLMALPLVREDSILTFNGDIYNQDIIDRTISDLAKFGIEIGKSPKAYFIPGRQMYKSPREISTSTDWSITAMWILAGAVSGVDSKGVYINGLKTYTKEGLEQLDKILTLMRFDFKYLCVDTTYTDNLSTIIIAMCLIKGSSLRLTGLSELKFKEYSRLKILARIAKQLGQEAEITENGFNINGSEHPNYEENTIIDCEGDPWVFMGFALAAAVTTVPFVLSDNHGADKIYRNFFKDFSRLGGQYEVSIEVDDEEKKEGE